MMPRHSTACCSGNLGVPSDAYRSIPKMQRRPHSPTQTFLYRTAPTWREARRLGARLCVESEAAFERPLLKHNRMWYCTCGQRVKGVIQGRVLVYWYSLLTVKIHWNGNLSKCSKNIQGYTPRRVVITLYI